MTNYEGNVLSTANFTCARSAFYSHHLRPLPSFTYSLAEVLPTFPIGWSTYIAALSLAMGTIALCVNYQFTFTSNHDVSLWSLPPSSDLTKSSHRAASFSGRVVQSMRVSLAATIQSRWRLMHHSLVFLYFAIDVIGSISLYLAVHLLLRAITSHLDLSPMLLLYILTALCLKAFIIAGGSRGTWSQACSYVRFKETTGNRLVLHAHMAVTASWIASNVAQPPMIV